MHLYWTSVLKKPNPLAELIAAEVWHLRGKVDTLKRGFCAKLHQKHSLLKCCAEEDFGKRSGMFV